MIEVVYEQQEEQAEVDKKLVAALDPGVNVLAAITSNKPGFAPRLVSGKPIKSVNQRYNQQRAEHQSRLAHEKRITSRRSAIAAWTAICTRQAVASFICWCKRESECS